jgi:hypothetical protein
VDLSCGGKPVVGATALLDGIQSVQDINAMYRSHTWKQPESIVSVIDKK